mmetsp:Transcript_4894/g.7887  ORF Transcript_4894/g.7887 Transcript_4894/m.7887 type:complete len:237 (-) Transcript_4894:1-711(-)
MPSTGATILSREEADAAYERAGGPKQVSVLQCACLRPLFTIIRDMTTPHPEFARAARRLMSVLAEEAIAALPSMPKSIETPCGPYEGVCGPAASDVCAVSIVRAGDSLLECVRTVWPEVSVGKILIQRDEETALPKLFYSKMPPSIASKYVLLVDPMLATGGSAVMAIKCLVDAGVPANKILFVNVVATKQGVAAILEAYPEVQIVTASMDEGLNEQAYIVPGLGDYGDRYFGTDC